METLEVMKNLDFAQKQKVWLTYRLIGQKGAQAWFSDTHFLYEKVCKYEIKVRYPTKYTLLELTNGPNVSLRVYKY